MVIEVATEADIHGIAVVTCASAAKAVQIDMRVAGVYEEICFVIDAVAEA